jgi:hypothetical protein
MKFSRFVGNSQKSFSKARSKELENFLINIKKCEIESCLERNNSITPESTKSEKRAKLLMIELIINFACQPRFEI